MLSQKNMQKANGDENRNKDVTLDIFKLKEAIQTEIWELEKFRLGKVLTVIDACIADPEQRKAIKDLIKGAYWDEAIFPKNIRRHLCHFDEKYTKQINDSDTYRKFMEYPTELCSEDGEVCPQPGNIFYK